MVILKIEIHAIAFHEPVSYTNSQPTINGSKLMFDVDFMYQVIIIIFRIHKLVKTFAFQCQHNTTFDKKMVFKSILHRKRNIKIPEFPVYTAAGKSTIKMSVFEGIQGNIFGTHR